jgi:quinol monooxygenase YgiN
MPELPWKTGSTTPGEGSVVVMASRLELKSLRDVPGFLNAAMKIRKQMLAAPGCLGVSLIAQPLAKTFWTLSAWQDRAALDATIPVEPHKSTMRRFGPKMADSKFVFWDEAGAAAGKPDWAEARRRLAAG